MQFKNLIGASLSKPHDRRSTVKSVLLLGCSLAHMLAHLLYTSSLIWLIEVYISTNLKYTLIH